MTKILRWTLPLLTFFAFGAPHPASAENADFGAWTDRYFDEYFAFNPSSATSAGFHDHDGDLEDYSQKGVKADIAWLHRKRTELTAFGPKPADLMTEPAMQWEMLDHSIAAQLFDLEEIRSWRRNPDNYSSGFTQSIFSLMSRTFAPQASRLRSVIAREKRVASVFKAARANLQRPPKIFTEIAIEQLDGDASFFASDVPAAFTAVASDAGSKALWQEFQRANSQVIKEFKAYEVFLKQKILPQSTGDFRLGEANYRKKLLLEEMVDTPLDTLLHAGYENLKANQEAYRKTAEKLDPKKTPAQILEQLSQKHAAPDELLAKIHGLFADLQAFIRDKNLLTLPGVGLPIVQETPPFARALTTASMDTPGPYETVAKEAFFNVTLPEKDWPATRVEEHMQGFADSSLVTLATHEALPGHFIQFLWLAKIPSKVRKLVGSGSNSEGWAHYCEQMMLDEGYGNGDLKLRLGQIQDALLRNARFIVGIRMHTGQMTYDEAIDFFVKEGYQTRANGEREAKRGTSDPTYLVYTLGKLEILKLREDYRKLKGDKFSLKEFHDAFLSQGTPAVKLVRRALMGRDGPML